ncbi:hypothetical protein A5895_26430 (plasmid) [Salmonella enterica subsp. enterica]|uniref:DNA replication protein n=1 Tax=Salmonella enterica I TaxID=59201 RepID=A0A345JNZ5_SALET|nr:hypothetical protein A5895_26430 [Salmonella enterica subsp. enterica]
MGSCAAPSAKGDDKFITTDYLQQCPFDHLDLVSLLFGRKHFTRIGASKMRIKNPHVCTAHKGVERIENIFGKRPVLGIHRLGNIGEP